MLIIILFRNGRLIFPFASKRATLANLDDQTEAKQKLIERIKQRSHYSLEKNTLFQEKKLNLFFWESR